ncbi:MAG: cytochrome c family protein, partial [Pontiella sp.]|nr:cytochrome c family protein [Pontiella sp.]
MKKQKTNRLGFRGIMLTAAALFGLGALQVDAQDLKINARPLTPQEIVDYGLTNTTQVSGGNHVVGLGQPVYLELMIDADLIEDGTVVTQAAWSLDAVVDDLDTPIASSAVIANSPLPSAMPTYDSVDRVAYEVLDRAVIVPDVRGTYEISAQALTTNGVLDASFEVVGSVFIGKDSAACLLCHASKHAEYNLTHHSTAFIEQINGEGSSHFQAYCIKCHTTGYDAAPGAVNAGFDDVAAAEGWTFPTELSTNNF